MSADVENVIAKRKEREEKMRKARSSLVAAEKAACECFSSESGREFLRWLVDESGFHKPSSVYNSETGEVVLNSTIHNEARRSLYLRVRFLLRTRPDILADVENNIKGEVK